MLKKIPKCHCCKNAREDIVDNRCNACIGTGCVESYAKFWKRGNDCPIREKARRGAKNRER